MLSDDQVQKIEKLNILMTAICEKLLQAKAKVEAIISIEEASIHPKVALIKIAKEALTLIAEGEEGAPKTMQL